jgi:hypothetical protein
MDRPFQIGDSVRVVRVPPNVQSPDYPFPEVRLVFESAVGKIYLVDAVDSGGRVSLRIGEGRGIAVQPDCVELICSEQT